MAESRNWFLEELERRGVSRRDFLGFCGVMTSVLALPKSVGAQIAEAIETKEKADPGLAGVPGLCREHRIVSSRRPAQCGRHRPGHALGRLPRDHHGGCRAPGRGGAGQGRRGKAGAYIAVVEGSIPTGPTAPTARSAAARRSTSPARSAAARGDDRHRHLRRVRRPPGGGAQPHRRAERGRRSARAEEPDQPARLPGQRREPGRAGRLLPDLQPLPAARPLPPAAVRLRQDDPRQLRAARPLTTPASTWRTGATRDIAPATASTRWAARGR